MKLTHSNNVHNTPMESHIVVLVFIVGVVVAAAAAADEVD
jgi:hypothetical protein